MWTLSLVLQPLGVSHIQGDFSTSINLILELPHRHTYVSTAILNPIKLRRKTDHHSSLRWRETQHPLGNFPGSGYGYPQSHLSINSGPTGSIVSLILHTSALPAAACVTWPFRVLLQDWHSLNHLNISWLLGCVPSCSFF